MLGNKTLCDICSSKAIRKARLKKEKEAPTAIEPPTENVDELAATTAPPPPPPTPTQHHHGAHDEGISI